MKKSVIILFFILNLLVINKAFCNGESNNFIQNFSKCNNYVENHDNKIFMILGWSNRRCYYKEVSYKEELTCSFKTLELQSLINSMKKENYNHKKGLRSLEAASNYVNSPEYCTSISIENR